MAKDKITEYDSVANNNTVVGDVNLQESSMLPSDVNNAIREVMSHQKEAFGSGTPLYVDQTNNRVGIGNSSPDVPLEISVAGSSITNVLKLTTTGSGTVPALQFEGDASGTQHIVGRIRGQQDDANDGGLVFETESSGTVAERMRILSSGGITFNGDTATANALDDYEEGTWTPTIIGASSGTKTAGSGNVGRYVVVGNHCTISGTVHCDGTETLSGAIAMGGLPFAVANISSYRIGCTLGGTTGLGMPSGYQSGFAMGGDPGNSFVYILARSTTGYSHNPTVANVTNLYGINMTYQIS